MKKLSSLKPYLSSDKDGVVRFTGKKMEVVIPRRFETYSLLHISNSITTLGVVDIIIDDKAHAPLCMLAEFELTPSDIREEEIQGITYLICTLEKNDVFMRQTAAIQNANIAYSLFTEFISLGKLPYWFTYETASKIFDTTASMTGSKLDVDHVIYELIAAHLHRDPDDMTKLYRHSTMRQDATYIPLKSISFGTQSTTSKVLGNYFADGVVSSLDTQNTEHYPIEDIVRV